VYKNLLQYYAGEISLHTLIFHFVSTAAKVILLFFLWGGLLIQDPVVVSDVIRWHCCFIVKWVDVLLGGIIAGLSGTPDLFTRDIYFPCITELNDIYGRAPENQPSSGTVQTRCKYSLNKAKAKVKSKDLLTNMPV
jgi:hypothetical protein